MSTIHEISENVRIRCGESVIEIPAKTILGDLLGRLHPANDPSGAIPRIGDAWPGQGGIYAGLVRGINGAIDCHLIVGREIENPKWEDAKAFAGGLEADGHTDFTLPTGAEQAVLYGNVPELFAKEWYWSGEQFPGNSDYAWNQHFNDGHQYIKRKDSECRARAVRRFS